MEIPTRKETPKVKPKEEGCEIKLRRDNMGRVIGIKTRGKCTREDKLLFAKDNFEDLNNE